MIKEALKKLVVLALKTEARAVLKKYRPKIVGITGSVGKTGTKDAIAVVLEKAAKVRAALAVGKTARDQQVTAHPLDALEVIVPSACLVEHGVTLVPEVAGEAIPHADALAAAIEGAELRLDIGEEVSGIHVTTRG